MNNKGELVHFQLDELIELIKAADKLKEIQKQQKFPE